MEDIVSCHVCDNTQLELGKCTYKGKTVAYNVFCPVCNFTGRSYRMRYKAIKRWNSLCRQTRSINTNDAI